jgi:hypothetical protein
LYNKKNIFRFQCHATCIQTLSYNKQNTMQIAEPKMACKDFMFQGHKIYLSGEKN